MFHEPGSIAQEGKLPDFAGLDGHIRITVGRDENPNLTIRDGRLTHGGRPANPVETATTSVRGGAEGYTPPEARVFNGPYLESPDGKYLAASIMLPDSVAFGDNKRYAFVVLDLESERVTLKTELSEWKVAGVAWSGDSKRIAILRRKIDIGFCPGDILSRIIVHSNFYSTWVVELVDPESGVTSAVQLASGLPGSYGTISWNR